MRSEAATIQEYLAALPSEKRSVMEVIDAEVRAVFPQAMGNMHYGMPTYWFGDRMFAFNSQKNHFAVYAAPEFVSKHKADLMNLDLGKSCIRFRTKEKMPMATIRKILNDYKRSWGK